MEINQHAKQFYEDLVEKGLDGETSEVGNLEEIAMPEGIEEVQKKAEFKKEKFRIFFRNCAGIGLLASFGGIFMGYIFPEAVEEGRRNYSEGSFRKKLITLVEPYCDLNGDRYISEEEFNKVYDAFFEDKNLSRSSNGKPYDKDKKELRWWDLKESLDGYNFKGLVEEVKSKNE